MKLLQKTARTYLVASTLALVVAGLLLFQTMTAVIQKEITEKLWVNAERVAAQMRSGAAVTPLPPILEIDTLRQAVEKGWVASDTSIYDAVEGEQELFRQLHSTRHINGVSYRITVRQVILEPHDYYNSIGLTLVLILAGLLVALLLINRGISRRLWKPFQQNLRSLKAFSVESKAPLGLRSSDINEFAELNAALRQLTEKARADYSSLKAFTENASHEMQTPLAVISSKLETLLQSDTLSEEEAGLSASAATAAGRLSRLIETLLLLTKIQNGQFAGRSDVSLAEAVKAQLTIAQDFIREKALTVRTSVNEGKISANPMLLDILLSNLIGNAVKHSRHGGEIDVRMEEAVLTISNIGTPLTVDAASLFDRFAKADASSKSLGLGLSIVKTICEGAGWRYFYTTEGTHHQFRIVFSASDFL